MNALAFYAGAMTILAVAGYLAWYGSTMQNKKLLAAILAVNADRERLAAELGATIAKHNAEKSAASRQVGEGDPAPN
ncbi:MAG TPA: hypothetical protein PLB01_00255 [Thermoanaerobaculia bacterium]|nr:hypothetical protein [Thermoanaerobaculia bacterium]